MPIDLQNPWFSLSNQNGAAPQDPAGNPNNTTNPGGNPYFNGPGQPTWGSSTPWGTGTKDAAMRKFFDPKNYASWDRDQWRAVTQESTGQGPGSILSELTGLIGQDGVNRHLQHFGAGGGGYLPGKFDWTTGKMGYQGYSQDLVNQANNSPWSGGGPQMVNYSPQGDMTFGGGTQPAATPGVPQSNGGSLGNIYNQGRNAPTGYGATQPPAYGAPSTTVSPLGDPMNRSMRGLPQGPAAATSASTVQGINQPLSQTGQSMNNRNRLAQNRPYYFQPMT